MGNLCVRIDYDLIYKIATHFEKCTLLLVGPRNDANHHSIDFDRLENVVFTGGKNIFKLPDYLAVMDCTIIPFKKNALTKSIYPLKINEYLAAGKPVVSTPFSPDIEAFSEVVYLGNNHDDFLRKIEQALSPDTAHEKKQIRIDVAKNNSWTARVNLFWQLVTEAIVNRGNGKS
jgi:glycosyltransferase involved in cell wall biosynthesis